MSEHHCAHCSRNRQESYYDCISENDIRSRDSIRNSHQRSANILQNLGDLREFYKQLQNFADITHEIFKKSSETKHHISPSSVSMHRRESNTSYYCNHNSQYSTDQRQSSQIYNDSEKNHSSGSHQELNSKGCNTYCRSASGWLPNRTQFPKKKRKYSLYMELENTDYTKCESGTCKLSQKTEHQGTHGTCSCTREHHDNDLKQEECLSQGNIKHNNSKRHDTPNHKKNNYGVNNKSPISTGIDFGDKCEGHDTPNHKKNNYGVNNKSPISTGIDFGDKCEGHNYLGRKYAGMCSRAVFPINHQTNSGCSTTYKNTQTHMRDANVSTEHNCMVNKEVQTHIQDTCLNKENNGMINKEVQTEFFKKSDAHINKNAHTFHSAPNLRDSRISSVVQNSKPNVLYTEKLNNKKLELIYFSQISEKFIKPSLQQNNSILNIKTISKLDQNKESDHKAEIETERKIEQATPLRDGIRKESSNIEHYQPTNKGKTHSKNENNCSFTYKGKQYEIDKKTASPSLLERDYTKKLRDSNQYHVRSQEIPSPVARTFVDKSKSRALSQKITVKSSEDQSTHIINNKSTDQKLKPSCSSIEISKPVETKNEISAASLIDFQSTKECNLKKLKNKEESCHTTESIHCFLQNKQQYKVANDTKNPMISITGSKKECVDIEQNHIRSQESIESDSEYICRIGEKSKPKSLDWRSAEENSEAENSSNINKKYTTYKLENECIDIEQNHIRSQESIESDSEYICRIGEKSKSNSLDWRSAEENSEAENNSNMNKKYTTYKLENKCVDIEQNHIRSQESIEYDSENICRIGEKSKPKSLDWRSAEENSETENSSNINKKYTTYKPKNTCYSMDTIYPIETEEKIQAKPRGEKKTKEFSSIEHTQLRNKDESHHRTKNIRNSVQNSLQHKFAKDATRPVPFESESKKEKRKLLRRSAEEYSGAENNPNIYKLSTNRRSKNVPYSMETIDSIETEKKMLAKPLEGRRTKKFSNINCNQEKNKEKSHHSTKNIRSSIQNNQQYKFARNAKRSVPFPSANERECIDIENHVESQESTEYLSKCTHRFKEKNRPKPLVRRSAGECSDVKGHPIINKTTHQKLKTSHYTIKSGKPIKTKNEVKLRCVESVKELYNIESNRHIFKKKSHNKTKNINSCVDKGKHFEIVKGTTKTLDVDQCHVKRQEVSGCLLKYLPALEEESMSTPLDLSQRSTVNRFKIENVTNNTSTYQQRNHACLSIETNKPNDTEKKIIQAKPLGGRNSQVHSNTERIQLRNKEESHHKTENILSFIQKSQIYKFSKDTTRTVSSVSGSKKECIDVEQNDIRNQKSTEYVSNLTSRIKEIGKPDSLVRKSTEEYFEAENNPNIYKKSTNQKLKNKRYFMKTINPIETEENIQEKTLGGNRTKEFSNINCNQLRNKKESSQKIENILSFIQNCSQRHEFAKDTTRPVPSVIGNKKKCIDLEQNRNRSQGLPAFVSKYTSRIKEKIRPKSLDRSAEEFFEVKNNQIINKKCTHQGLKKRHYIIVSGVPIEPLGVQNANELDIVEYNQLTLMKKSDYNTNNIDSSLDKGKQLEIVKDTLKTKPFERKTTKQETPGYVSKYTCKFIEEKPLDLSQRTTVKSSEVDNEHIKNNKTIDQKPENACYCIGTSTQNEPKKEAILENPLDGRCLKDLSNIECNLLKNKKESVHNTETICNTQQNNQQYKFAKDTPTPVPFVIGNKDECVDVEQNRNKSQKCTGYVSKYTRWFEEKSMPKSLGGESTEKYSKIYNYTFENQKSTNGKLENNSYSEEKGELNKTGNRIIQKEQIYKKGAKNFSSVEHNQLKNKEQPLPQTESIRSSERNDQHSKFIKYTTKPVSSVIESKKKWIDINKKYNRSQEFSGYISKYTRRFEEKSMPKSLEGESAEKYFKINNNNSRNQNSTNDKLENNSYSEERGKLIKTEKKIMQKEQIYKKGAKNFSSIEHNQLKNKEQPLPVTENIRSSTQNDQHSKFIKYTMRPQSSVIETKKKWININKNYNRSQEFSGHISKYTRRFEEKNRPTALILRSAKESAEVENNHNIYQESTVQGLKNKSYSLEKDKLIETEKVTQAEIIDGRSVKEFSSIARNKLRHKGESLLRTENIRNFTQSSQQYKVAEDATSSVPYMSESKKKLFDAEQNQNLIKSLKLPGYILKYTSRFEEENRLTPPVRMRVKQSSEVKNNPIISNKLTHQRLENNCCIIGPGQPIETDVRVIQTIQVKEFSRDESYQLRNRAETHNCTDKVHSSKQNSQQYKFAKDIKKPAPKNEWIYIKGNHDGSQELLTYVPKKFEEKSRPVPLVSSGAEESSKVEYNQNIHHESINEKLGNNYYPVKTGQLIESEIKTIQSKTLAGERTDESFNVERIQVENKEKSHHETKNILSSIAKDTQHKIAKDTATLISSDGKSAEGLFESAQMHIEKK